MPSISSGSVVTSLIPLMVIVGLLGVFLLLGIYHLDIHNFHQEWLVPVGLHLKLQYLSTNGGH